MADNTPGPTTPSRNARPDIAGHTRPAEEEFPNLQRASKRNKAAGTTVVPIRLGRNAAGPPNNSARALLGARAKDTQRLANLAYEVTLEFATALDAVVDKFDKNEKPDHYAKAVQLVTDFIRYSAETTTTEGPSPSLTPTRNGGGGTAAPPKNRSVSWADIARGGEAQPHQAKPSGPHPPANHKPGIRPPVDRRLLIRLPPHTTKLAGIAVRRGIEEALEGVNTSDIPEVTMTKTGYALRPANATIRDTLLAQKDKVINCLGAEALDTAERWTRYILEDVPVRAIGAGNTTIDCTTPTLLMSEIRAQSGQTPVNVVPTSKGINPEKGTVAWIVSFREPVRATRWRLFNAGKWSRLLVPRLRAETHNPGCQGFCNPNRCARTARCPICSLPVDHHTGPADHRCTNPPRCANCHGPAPAGHNNCPARPIRAHGRTVNKTKSELIKIRNANHREAAKARRQNSPPQTEEEALNMLSAEDLARIIGPRQELTNINLPAPDLAPQNPPSALKPATGPMATNRFALLADQIEIPDVEMGDTGRASETPESFHTPRTTPALEATPGLTMMARPHRKAAAKVATYNEKMAFAKVFSQHAKITEAGQGASLNTPPSPTL